MTHRLMEHVEDLPGEWTDTYWAPSRALPYEVYEKIWTRTADLKEITQEEDSTLDWWLGDQMNNAEMDVGDDYYQFIENRQLTKWSLIKIRRLSEEFKAEERWHPSKVSSWTHWEVVRIKDNPYARQKFLAKYAEDETYSRDDLRADVKAWLEEHQPSQDELPGTEESELPDCPLCEGAGKVTHDRRQAYLMEEGVVA
jgi:hypothetical protein